MLVKTITSLEYPPRELGSVNTEDPPKVSEQTNDSVKCVKMERFEAGRLTS